MRFAALMIAAGTLAFAAENTLTPEEKQEGFVLLFDGTSMKGWKDPSKKAGENQAWVVENGALKTVKNPKFSEDLISQKVYGDFDLKFDWKISPKGNTGLKYRIQREIFLDESKYPGLRFEEMMGRESSHPQSDRKTFSGGHAQLYTVGFEFQLLDNEGHPDGRRDASHRTGALYSFIPPDKDASKPVGEWNSSRLVVKGDHFEHWVNGTKVLEGSLKDPRVKEGADKRWEPAPVVRDLLVNAKSRGPIALQHHGDEAWFRNIKLRELK